MQTLAAILTVMLLPLAPPRMLEESFGNLIGPWLFRIDAADTGERDGWQRPDFDDGAWRTLQAPGYWEPQGITDPRPGRPPQKSTTMAYTDYDGVAWYRLHFVVPAAWAGQELALRLGSVDDQDRTFFNGQLVGAIGPGVPNSVGKLRRYRVPAGLVKPGAENVLAVRVLDSGGPGGLMGPDLSLVPRSFMERPMKAPTSDRPLTERLTDPPADARILPIKHNLPDDADAQDELFAQLIAQGFGGFVANVNFRDYLVSEAKWQAYVRGVKRAKELGLAMWVYDERGYPSGNAGGLVMKGHPEWQARGLLVAQATSTGGAVSLAVPPGPLRLAAAFPTADNLADPARAVDLRAQVKDQQLAWTAPAGSWQVLVMTEDALHEGTHAAINLHEHIPYVNLLQPEPTARFLELTHDEYARRLGPDLGHYFMGTFTDEPSLMSAFMRPMPYAPLPWAVNLPAAFAQRRGYALEPKLAALVLETADSAKVRYDYWLTVGELVSENFFGQIQERCRKYRVPSGGHLLCEEPLLSHVPLYGDFFRCLRRLDAPSIDCLTSLPPQVPWYIGRLASSAAALNGTVLTMCEVSDHSQRYRPQGDTRPVRQVTEAEILGTCNRLIAGGINCLTSYYAFAGLDTTALRRINGAVGRACTMLRGGAPAAEVALVYPVESIWPRYHPLKHNWGVPAAQPVEQAYHSAANSLWTARREFCYVDSATLTGAKVEAGALVSGQLRWRVVVLPRADTLPLAAWRNLARFAEQGGVVVALGARPANSEREFPSAEVTALGRKLFGDGGEAGVTAQAGGGAGVWLPAGSDDFLAAVLDAALDADVAVEPADAPLRATHRRIDGHEVYFVFNDSPEPCRARLRLAGGGAGQEYRAATGQATARTAGEAFDLQLAPYEGVLYRLPAAAPLRRRPLAAGKLPGLVTEALPPVEPTVGGGEFVKGQLSRAGDAWHAEARLTKSAVDTHQFVSFAYPAGLDLSQASYLLFEVTVPAGQRPPTQLLVILHEQGGGDFIASTGLSLAQPGRTRVVFPLSRLQLAGWSKDADGRLDLRRIERIAIGWGGYFGTEGERLEFTIGGLQWARRER